MTKKKTSEFGADDMGVAECNSCHKYFLAETIHRHHNYCPQNPNRKLYPSERMSLSRQQLVQLAASPPVRETTRMALAKAFDVSVEVEDSMNDSEAGNVNIDDLGGRGFENDDGEVVSMYENDNDDEDSYCCDDEIFGEDSNDDEDDTRSNDANHQNSTRAALASAFVENASLEPLPVLAIKCFDIIDISEMRKSPYKSTSVQQYNLSLLLGHTTQFMLFVSLFI
jgi:hypothetical protein